MNFGEGGAGRVHRRQARPPASTTRMVRKVIETFARYGAPDHILVEGKPHIGSDLLPGAVARLREELHRRRLRGAASSTGWRTCSTATAAWRACGWRTGARWRRDRVVLAPGNSRARAVRALRRGRPGGDGGQALRARLPGRAPPGAHQHHPVRRAAKNPKLPPADYKLAENLEVDGEVRGIYSFCMCPGGIVVPTPTEDGLQCTNGMSNSPPQREVRQRGHRGLGVRGGLRARGLPRSARGAGVPAPLGAARRTSWAEAGSSPRRRPSRTTSPGA